MSNLGKNYALTKKYLNFRGPESAQLLEPWEKPIDIMAYQYSVSTDPIDLVAEVVVYYKQSELTQYPKKVN